MIKKIFNSGKKSGMTLFIAVVIMGILLFISFAVVNITIKGTLFASSGRDSQFAFYAADAGLECALYWDSKFDTSKFDPSTDGSPISCGGDTDIRSNDIISGTTTRTQIGGGGGTTLSQTVSEGGTASLSCSSGTITGWTSKYGNNAPPGSACNPASTCPANCGTCSIGSASCSVTYSNKPGGICDDCAYGCAKNGDLSITCSDSGGGSPISNFGFSLNSATNPSNACAIVTVTKDSGTTHIYSRGYNTCDTSNPRRVERGVEVTY